MKYLDGRKAPMPPVHGELLQVGFFIKTKFYELKVKNY